MIIQKKDFYLYPKTLLLRKKVNLLAGQIHKIIQEIITQKSKGNVVIANSIQTKMYLKGIAGVVADTEIFVRTFNQIQDGEIGRAHV